MPDGVGTTHHIKLGTEHYMVREGTYRKSSAPQFGARFTTGDPDLNNLSFWQHWGQTCWIGGIGAETWMDDSMYDQALGVDTTQHEVVALSRDLGPNSGRAAANWDFGNNTVGREFVIFKEILWCVTYGDATSTSSGSRLWKYNPAAGGSWSLQRNIGSITRSVCVFKNRMYWGTDGSDLKYMAGDLTTYGTTAKPGSETNTPSAMMVYKDKLYVGFGDKLQRMKTDFSWDIPSSAVPFAELPGIDYLVAMELNLGFLYAISRNGHVIRTDANNTNDLWQWDASVRGVSLRSYDGRLFVGTFEPTDPASSTNEGQGCIYQFTGSAVTELKRWGKMTRTCSPGKLRVVGNKMFYGASDNFGIAPGFGIAVYDAREDAHSIYAKNSDTVTYTEGTNGHNFQVDDVIFFGGYLFAAVRGWGIFKTLYQYRDIKTSLATYDTTSAGASATTGNGGWLSSSDFDAGTPGLRKLWNKVTIHADLPNSVCTIVFDYSLDGGATWQYVQNDVNKSIVSKTTSATRYAKVLYLNNVTATRFKWRVWLRTTNSTYSPLLLGVVVAYLPQPEPNFQWQMTLVLNEVQELLDGTTSTNQAVATKAAQLETLWRTQMPVYFKDIDSTEWTVGGGAGVIVFDFQKIVPFVGPSSDGVIEAEYRITLIEAIEAY